MRKIFQVIYTLYHPQLTVHTLPIQCHTTTVKDLTLKRLIVDTAPRRVLFGVPPPPPLHEGENTFMGIIMLMMTHMNMK